MVEVAQGSLRTCLRGSASAQQHVVYHEVQVRFEGLVSAVQESALVVLEVTLKAEAERAAASEAEDRRQQQDALARRSSSGNGEGPL